METNSFWGVIVNGLTDDYLEKVEQVISWAKDKGCHFLILAGYDSDKGFGELAKFCRIHSRNGFLIIPVVNSTISKTEYLPTNTKLIASSPLNLNSSLACADEEDEIRYKKLAELREDSGFCYVYAPNKEWKTWYVPYVYFNGFAWNGRNEDEFQEVVDYYLGQRLRTKLIAVNDLSSSLMEKNMLFTCVNCSHLTKEAIIKAISQGKSFFTETKNISIDFTIGKKGMGETLHTKSLSMINLELKCFSEKEIKSILIIKNSHLIKKISPQERVYKLSFKDEVRGDSYYRVVVTDCSGRICFSNSIFVKTVDWAWGDHHIHLDTKRAFFLSKEIGLTYAQLSRFILPKKKTFINVNELKKLWGNHFLILPGGEFHPSGRKGDKYGVHLLAFPIERGYEGGIGSKETLDLLEKDGKLAFIAHPCRDKRLDFSGFRSFQEKEEFYPKFDGIEILHGGTYFFVHSPYPTPEDVCKEEVIDCTNTEALWDDCLTFGLRCTGIANSDARVSSQEWSSSDCVYNYTVNWGLGLHPTITHVEKLQAKEIYKSLREGYCCFTDGNFRYLNIWLEGKHMGEVFKKEKGQKSAILRILAESTQPIRQLIIIANGKIVEKIRTSKDYVIDIKTRLNFSKNLRYLRVKVMDKEGHIIFSNPIYLREPLSKKEAVELLAKEGYRRCR